MAKETEKTAQHVFNMLIGKFDVDGQDQVVFGVKNLLAEHRDREIQNLKEEIKGQQEGIDEQTATIERLSKSLEKLK